MANAKTSALEEQPLVAVGHDFNSEVMQLLEQVLTDHPDRKDLRLKLLKLHYDQGDVDAFVKQAELYQEHIGDEDDQWDLIHEMAYSLKTGGELFSRRARPKLTVAEVEKVMPNRRLGEGDEAAKALQKLAKAYAKLREDPRFLAQLDLDLVVTVGRPTPLLFASRLSKNNGGASIYIKRDDFTASYTRLRTHLMGQAWIAKQLGMRKVLYATKNGFEAVLAARAAAHNGLQCSIFIPKGAAGCSGNERFEIELIGAEIRDAKDSSNNNDIREAALEYWLISPQNTFMMLSLDAGPHPYPTIANDIQAVIGRESLRQIKTRTGGMPRAIFARGGDTPDAIGFIDPYLGMKEVEILLVTPDESDLKASGKLAQRVKSFQTLMEQNATRKDDNRSIVEYARLEREADMIAATGRVGREVASFASTWNTISALAETEGMVVPYDSASVLARACEYAKKCKKNESVLVLLSEGYD